VNGPHILAFAALSAFLLSDSLFGQTPAPQASSHSRLSDLNDWDHGSGSSKESDKTKVWVNTKSGLYFYPHSRWYGKTKQGRYMTLREARSKGYKEAQGNAN
jgi:hypothetical protein